MNRMNLLPIAGAAICALGAPATAAVTVYTSEAAFDAAISGATSYVPVANSSFGTASYSLGPVTITAPSLVTYTGDYGAGVKSVGAFLSPVDYTTGSHALGLLLGYYVGPQTATYTIDGVTGTITVPAHPNTTFIGFVDTKAIDVSFATDAAEFDTIRAVTGTPLAAAVPEPATWAMMILGVGMIGIAMRAARRPARLTAAI